MPNRLGLLSVGVVSLLLNVASSIGAEGTGRARLGDLPAAESKRLSVTPMEGPGLVRFVDDDDAPGGDGTTWATAYQDLQDALAEAGTNGLIGEIRIAAGTYRPDRGTGDRTTTFGPLNDVAIRGGYGGVGAADPDERDPAWFVTVLSGDLDQDDGPFFSGNAENSFHVVTFAAVTDRTAILDGITIRGGNATTPTSAGTYGGGMIIRGSPTLIGCTVAGNSAPDRGGGANLAGGQALLLRCSFRANRAGGGGGLSLSSASPVLSDCDFVQNQADAGGAIVIGGEASRPSFRGCVIAENSADWGGGLFFDEQANPTFANCRVTGNHAVLGGALGGFPGRLGGFVNCAISGNSASSSGGAAYVEYSQFPGPRYTNCSIADNAASGVGGMFYGGDGVRITNCILWGNRDQDGTSQSAQIHGDFLQINFSCIQGLTGSLGGAGNIGSDPLFLNVDGPDNIPGTEDDDLHLRDGSPCIDAGSNGAVPPDDADLDGDGDEAEPVPLDLSDDRRFQDDPLTPDSGDGIPPIVDMGAHEGAHLGFIVTPSSLTVPEGSAATFSVALSGDPGGPVDVAVFRQTGDDDIAVQSGGMLLFDSGNYAVPQGVALSAGQDLDFTNGSAIVWITAPGMAMGDVAVTEADDEPVPEILFVNSSAAGAGTGMNWSDAFPELRDALAAAANRQGVREVWVAAGTYAPDGPVGSRAASFHLDGDIQLYGGFAGNESSKNERDPEANLTVLSGDLNGDDGTGRRLENSYHVVIADTPFSTPVLDGFTITGGNAAGSGNGEEGDSFGGGLYLYLLYNPAARVVNCNFVGNTASDGGGAVYYYFCRAVFENCTFTENSATRRGGAIYASTDASLSAVHCTFAGNSALSGGAIFGTEYAAGTLSHCSFSGNAADLPPPYQSSQYGGGAIWWTGYGDLDLVNAVFAGNHARGARGGAVVQSGGGLAMTNCTISGNRADLGVGGVAGSFTRLTNSILWGNTSPYGTLESAQITSGLLTVNYSAIQGWTGGLGGVGNIGSDPRFVDADGPDNLAGTLDDDLHLSRGSPCINAGNGAALPADLFDLDGDGDTAEAIPFDLDRKPRVTGPAVDMGAYEVRPRARLPIIVGSPEWPRTGVRGSVYPSVP